MPSLVLIELQIKEKERGALVPPPPPAYMVPKYPSLNRVKPCSVFKRITKSSAQSKEPWMYHLLIKVDPIDFF